MNIFQAIYCNQYAELKRNGRDVSKARKNGILLITAMLVLDLFLLMMLINIFADDSSIGITIKKLFSQLPTGRQSGRLIGIVLFVIVVSMVYVTVGRKEYFNKSILRFEALDEPMQKDIEKKATIFVFGSIGLLFILLMLFLFVLR